MNSTSSLKANSGQKIAANGSTTTSCGDVNSEVSSTTPGVKVKCDNNNRATTEQEQKHTTTTTDPENPKIQSSMGDENSLQQIQQQQPTRTGGPVLLEGTPTMKDASNNNRGIWWWQRRKCFVVTAVVVAVVLLLASLVIAIPMATLVESGGETADDILPVVGEPNQSEITLVVPGMTDETIQTILSDPLSPQAIAYNSMVLLEEDPTKWEMYEDWRKQQRFALACIIEVLDPSTSYNSLQQNTNECSWTPASLHVECNPNGWVTELHIFSTRSIQDDRRVGPIPAEIAFLSHLEVIDASDVWLSQSLAEFLPPRTLQGLPALRDLTLRGCELWGSNPSSLGLLTNLQILDVSMNQLSSTIPSELGLISNLEKLILSSNTLTGKIPNAIGYLSFLSEFQITNNPSVEEPLPAGFCNNGHMPLVESLQTDWCSGIAECCVI